MHRVGGVEMFLKAAFVEGMHPGPRGLVVNGPQAHDYGAHAGDLKGAAKTEHTFAGLHLTNAGVAGR